MERVAPAIEKIPNKISFEDRKKANSLLIRSYSFITASQPNEALLLLAQASKLSPYDPDIASSYGYALYLNGQHENAKNTLLLAQQLKPDFAEIYRFLAMTAAALNDRKWAKDSLLNYYKYANHKDIAIGEMRRMLIERSESDSIKLAAKEVLSIVAINK
uniref:Uncharacterized protein n=1 Tax=Curvibacter symbiont subsp. Hydra magnipapillata TaxID=667019 RepID=C9Y6P5_CURXX|nr:hypothetical protein Csp_E36220 [Curvibacter putative symbiont of Hydra magnipapillata]